MSGRDPGFQMAAPEISRPCLSFAPQDNQQQDSGKAGSGDFLGLPLICVWAVEARGFLQVGGASVNTPSSLRLRDVEGLAQGHPAAAWA